MDHLARIQRAIDYIEQHLKEELPTEAIAREACFSMWHFQKVFGATVGETLKEYVRKRRLSSALMELVASDRRIIEVAVDHQFDSQESFTRAFKAMFGFTPGEVRKNGIRSVHALNKPRITMEYLDHLYGGMTMQPRIIEIQGKKVVGLGTNFISILSPEKNNHIVLPKLWDSYLKRSSEIKSRTGRFDIGLCEAVADASKKVHPDEYFYMACAEVQSFDSVPAGMVEKVVPAGAYAVFTHRGGLDKLEHTMSYIFGSWLPKSGKTLREAPDLEIYDERFKFGSESSEVDIYIPIQ